MPSRMSCSDAMSSGRPVANMIRSMTSAPAAMTSARPGCMTPRAARSRSRHRDQSFGDFVNCGGRDARDRWIRRASYSSRPSASATTVVTVPASPMIERAWPIGTSCAASAMAASTSARTAATCSGVGGSDCMCRSVIRTQPTSTERAVSGPPGSGCMTNSVDPPPRSTTKRGLRVAAHSSAGSSRVAPVYESKGFFCAAHYFGCDSESRLHTVDEQVSISCIARCGCGDETKRNRRAVCRSRLGDKRGVLVAGGERALDGSARELSGPIDALTQTHDAHFAGDVRERLSLRVDVGNEQSDRVRAAVDRGHSLGAHLDALIRRPLTRTARSATKAQALREPRRQTD